MERIRPIYCPPVPGVSWFQELNVRSYVYDEQGRPGIWFYSLDCNQWLAVKIARKFFNLPYEHAKMSFSNKNGEIAYQSQRSGEKAVQSFLYPTQLESSCGSELGSLEFFLLERYRLFSVDSQGSLYQGIVNHRPYQFQRMEVQSDATHLISLAGFEVSATSPVSSMIARTVDVEVFPLCRL